MPKKVLNLLLLVVWLFCAESAFAQKQETGFLNRSVSVGDVSYRYQVYVPADYTAKKKWAVILFLHGAGERGKDGVLPTDHGIGTAIRRHAERFPAIVVFPQCRTDAVWAGAMERSAMKALEETVKEFNGDPTRLYLTGNSLGGYGTWHFAARHPGKFAAIVPVAGGIVPPPKFLLLPEIVELERKGDSYIAVIKSANPYAGVARLIGKTPVWIFHGETDTVVAVTEARKMAEALKAAGGNVKYTEYAGKGHGITDASYAEPEFAAWLLSQRLDR